MRILLDTHILIWFLEGNASLANSRRLTVADAQNDVFLSVVSLWEIAIKISLGKLTLSYSLEDVIKQLIVENIVILPLAPCHILEVAALPFHHRDPFDRMIIAQSKVDSLLVMTDDVNFAAYGIKIL